MNLSYYLLGFGLAAALSMPVSAKANDEGGGKSEPLLNARGQALQEIELDREAVINEQAAAMPLRDAEANIAELHQLENHELIDRMVGVAGQASPGGAGVGLLRFGSLGDNADMVYTALDGPCRILDTRAYSTGGANPISGNVAREVWNFAIGSQGANLTCASPLFGKSALVMSLTAISPTFPSKFPGFGYGTLLNGSEVSSGWTPISPTPPGQFQYSYDTPPYTDAVSVVWDLDTAFIQTLAVVSNNTVSPRVVLFSASPAHYTIDVVGYFDEPELCASGNSFISGLCWGPVETAATWFVASNDCASQGGRLPSSSVIRGVMGNGDLTNEVLWANGYYYDGGVPKAQANSTVVTDRTTTTATPYRCVFTPLTHP